MVKRYTDGVTGGSGGRGQQKRGSNTERGARIIIHTVKSGGEEENSPATIPLKRDMCLNGVRIYFFRRMYFFQPKGF